MARRSSRLGLCRLRGGPAAADRDVQLYTCTVYVYNGWFQDLPPDASSLYTTG